MNILGYCSKKLVSLQGKYVQCFKLAILRSSQQFFGQVTLWTRDPSDQWPVPSLSLIMKASQWFTFAPCRLCVLFQNVLTSYLTFLCMMHPMHFIVFTVDSSLHMSACHSGIALKFLFFGMQQSIGCFIVRDLVIFVVVFRLLSNETCR